MASKGAKETLVSKLGFKSSSASKAEAELEKVRKENAHLKKKLDDMMKQHIRPLVSDKSTLLERILSLETLRERNNQQLLVKEQELETLRQQLSAKGGEVVASLQAQLDQRRREAEQRDAMFQNLSHETENLKNKLATVSARCQSLETQTTNGQAPPAELTIVQDQLRDALEKNQQWLVYDQQREAFVQSVVARTQELEQQLAAATQQQQHKTETSQEASSGPEKKDYNEMLSDTKKDLTARVHQELKEQTVKAQAELHRQKEQLDKVQEEASALRRKYEDKCTEFAALARKHEEAVKELAKIRTQLQVERAGSRQAAYENKKVTFEQAGRMRAELESVEKRLEEEKIKSTELLLQVNMLQKSLLSQNEDQRRIAALEQQIQVSAKDFENERIDRQSMQQQLQKVLKELRKARDQISKLESAKQPNARFSEPSSYSQLDIERLAINEPRGHSSPSKVISLLDESFLECPKCRASYPTSRHRELLAHIDYCFA